MDPILYTLFEAADLPALRQLMHDYLTEFDPESIYADDEYFTALLHGVRTGTHTIWLARKDGISVGFALVRIEQQWYRETVKLGIFEEFYVAPAYRRQGIGRALVARAAEGLRAQGVTAISASVVQANVGGLLFWQRLGFRIEAYHLFLTRRS
ncbi:MAG TPA: GNAT family N-acetyltransferase [Chloroflexota bacterium]|nr:GNAT family N-acetyltransferase [Chloroflexota bacterium]